MAEEKSTASGLAWATFALSCCSVVLVPVVGWVIAGDIKHRMEASQLELSEASAKIAQIELLRRQAVGDTEIAIAKSNEIISRDAAIEAIDRSIPTIEVRSDTVVMNNALRFDITIKNTSRITIKCDRPYLYINKGANEGRESGEKSLMRDGYYPISPGTMAPGQIYRTRWDTPDRDGPYWANISIACRPTDFRREAIVRFAELAGVIFDETQFELNFDSWYTASE